MQYNAVFHVDQNDEQVFNLALNNVINLLNAIPGQEHDLIVLCNGPAVALLHWDNAVFFLERIKTVLDQGVRLQACDNALKRFEVDPAQLIDGVEIIPAGIVALIDLQKGGYAYIKP
ncbi:MAG: DsrE family protein [Desulfobulbaceae bacterium]|uniref:DsrE family protein n=1 Tax=Candidatus Desulfatifera sulfidica TaxID=2841691 RepID=A0A8J6NAI5_9BACT|nr:DsrE family protein [Candidatus Desulfatifera sulfidica]